MTAQPTAVNELYVAGDRAKAAAAIADAVSNTSGSEQALLQLANLALANNDFSSSNAAFDAVVNRAPENADYRNIFATALIYQGEFSKAEAQLNAALEHNRGHARTYFNLSLIHKAEKGDPAFDVLENLLRSGALEPNDQYAVRLALGKFYDDIGEFDRAFSLIDAAKKSPNIAYDHQAQSAFFQRIKTAFDGSFIKGIQGAGSPSAKPIFIVGMPRTGSSLLESMLARNSKIAPLGERAEFTMTLDALVQKHNGQSGYLGLLETLSTGDFTACGEDYLSRLQHLTGDAAHFTDKNLLNFLRIGMIKTILPKATIVHMGRNPVDTCLSCYFQTLDPSMFPFTFDLENIAHYYTLYEDLMAHWRNVLPDTVVDISYEKLIADPSQELSPLHATLGLENEATDEKPQTETFVATASAWQARQPVYETSRNRWRNYEKYMAPVLAVFDKAGISYD